MSCDFLREYGIISAMNNNYKGMSILIKCRLRVLKISSS